MNKAVLNSKLENGYACSFVKKFKPKFSKKTVGTYKLSIKMKKGYTLKKIRYGVWNEKKSKMVYKTVKNNSKIAIPKMNDNTDWRIIITYKDKQSGATVDYQLVGIYYYN